MKMRLQDRRCSSCNKTFKKIYGLPLPSEYDIPTISDGWNNDKICHYCFPKALDNYLEAEYQQYLKEGGTPEHGCQ